ncbi:MAG: hypothetical protein LBN32_00020 [Helicobacteraceae bacterium]|nr:hypothetical protein [Helicobacteraceae bacterium]
MPLLLAGEVIAPKTIYLTHEPLGQRLYVGEVAAITYNLLITEGGYERLETDIGAGAGVTRIGSEPRWQFVDTNRRKLTIYYEITAPLIVFPPLKVEVITGGQIDTDAIEAISATAQRPAVNPQFCGVIAHDLSVVTHKVERFNNTHNIVAMELNGELSNLNRFSLSGVEKQGIDWIDIKMPITRIFYYALIDPQQSEISFNYLEPISGDFKRISFALDLSNLGQRISTHTDINPNKRAFPWAKMMILSVAVITLIVAFFKTHKVLFLALVAVVAGLIFWIAIRDESIIIKAGAQVRLLPTGTSTLFYTTDRPTQAILLKEKSGFVKVLLPDEKIGWVKAEETQ